MNSLHQMTLKEIDLVFMQYDSTRRNTQYCIKGEHNRNGGCQCNSKVHFKNVWSVG